MHAGDYYSIGTDTPEAQSRLSGRLHRQAGQPADEDSSAHPAMRRVWAALAWAVGGIAVFVLFLRISLTAGVSSDAANNALQSWDMLHGHLLLHGWIIGDATYYTFELPMIAIVEIFFGTHTITMHVALALIYLIVAACAVAIAVTDSRGASRAARAAVVVAVLAAPLLVFSDMWIPIGLPDHTGTTVFLLVSCLLVDRAPARRFTAPLLCVILCAGQLGDVTVRYVAVPAIALVCAYRAVAARKILTDDAVNVVAAVASIPLAIVVRAGMRHFGAYLMVAPKTKIAPVSQWQHNTALAWNSLRMLFGEQAGPATRPVGTAAIFGAACLLVAGLGVLRVLWRWRTARRAEQVLLVAIAANLGVYVISTLPSPRSPHDIVAVLPCGAILGARALVPARIAGRLTALAATGVAAVAALLPLSVIAAQPTAVPPWGGLANSLQAHGLRYGLAGYWDGSAVTLQSGNQVQVRTVMVTGHTITPYPWETNTLWFEPSRHYANFVIIDLNNHDLGTFAARYFGKPASTYRVGKNWEILIFNKNLLKEVKPATLPPVN
jgi:hypothetical protein